ncbi:MAG: histidine kinase dimerization/phospho-acceptor domain-containing protein, partial [Culicoidibacterales bacterium]
MKFPFIQKYKKQVIVGIFAFFIICQLAGFGVLTFQFANFKVDSLTPELEAITAEVAKTGVLPEKPVQMLLRIVDQNGVILSPTDVRPFTLTSFWPTVITNLDSRSYYANIEKIPELSERSLIIVMPVPQTTTFVLGIAPIGDLRTALISFATVFSSIFLIATSLIGLLLYFYHRETQHLLHLQKNYVETMTHELKTPITAIRALTETLQDGIITDPKLQQHYLTIIHDENQKLAHLVNESLTLAAVQ